ncbi:MAG: CheR family methyltransferase [Promethearchaeota archaeon]
MISELKKATGMKFEHYQRNFLEKRIYYRMKNLELEDYHQYITYIKSNPDEVDLFLDKFTINYTYFFRNSNIFESFEKFLNIYVKDLNRPLKIWSAPCATGDEPYSIAMVLDQIKTLNNKFPDFEIIGSDIDKNALQIAEEGVYGEYAMHETPEILINTYFSEEDTELGPKYTINEKIKNKVRFLQEDIIKGHQNTDKYDVIFCRNFIIYINQYAREKLTRVLESRLHNGGLLILGGSETFPPQNTCFEPISLRDKFYIKNLSSLDNAYRQKIINLFKIRKVKEARKLLENVNQSKDKRIIKKSESIQKRNLIDRKKEILEEKIQVKEHSSETDIKATNLNKKKDIQSVLKNKKLEPAEVRITGIVVNKSYDTHSPKSIKKSSTPERIKPMESKKASHLEKKEKELAEREEELNSRELSLKKREERLEQMSVFLRKELDELKQQRKKIQKFYRNAREKEKEVDDKVSTFKQQKTRLEKREQAIEQKERQLQDRLNQVGQYSRQIIQREIQININSKEVEVREEGEQVIPFYDERRYDRVEKANNKKEFILPMGYYGLINSFDRNISGTKFSIQGLGSGIGLILKDAENNIFAMAHISLPNSSASKQGYHLLFPHTFVDTSVKDLFNSLIYNGATESNIKAIIVGGAKLFLDYDMTYKENLDSVKHELKSLEIEIEAEDTGGLSERSVVYDTINDALYVRKSWEFQYRKIA